MSKKKIYWLSKFIELRVGKPVVKLVFKVSTLKNEKHVFNVTVKCSRALLSSAPILILSNF